VHAEKDLLPRKAVTKKTQPCVAAPEKVLLEEDWEMWSVYIVARPILRKVSWSPYGLLRADISGGGYLHHPPVNICGQLSLQIDLWISTVNISRQGYPRNTRFNE
jgi:hypothetical protein